MKTKNNVQKAILRSAAVVVSFVLISFTVSAQGFWKRWIENSSFNDIVMAMVETPADTKLTTPAESQNAMYFENEVEPEMEVEDWMTDDTNFDVNTFQYKQVIDVDLNVEAWMLDQGLFESENTVETALELEAWMVAEKVWNI